MIPPSGPPRPAAAGPSRRAQRRAESTYGAAPLLRAGVAATALVLSSAACGAATTTTAPSAPASPSAVGGTGANVVSVANFAFSPKTLTVKLGTTVTWTNHDGVVHNITWHSGGLPPSSNLEPGTDRASYSHTFTATGTFPYICGIHPTMSGTVVVTP